jgi:hypothetical protein
MHENSPRGAISGSMGVSETCLMVRGILRASRLWRGLREYFWCWEQALPIHQYGNIHNFTGLNRPTPGVTPHLDRGVVYEQKRVYVLIQVLISDYVNEKRG